MFILPSLIWPTNLLTPCIDNIGKSNLKMQNTNGVKIFFYFMLHEFVISLVIDYKFRLKIFEDQFNASRLKGCVISFIFSVLQKIIILRKNIRLAFFQYTFFQFYV